MRCLPASAGDSLCVDLVPRPLQAVANRGAFQIAGNPRLAFSLLDPTDPFRGNQHWAKIMRNLLGTL